MVMKPIRTYKVHVYGFNSDTLYSARSPSKARAQAWRLFNEVYSKSFHEFLVISRVQRVPDPPGIGQRILVAGEPATRVIGYGQYVHFMRDDSDVVLLAHPADVSPMPAEKVACPLLITR